MLPAINDYIIIYCVIQITKTYLFNYKLVQTLKYY